MASSLPTGWQVFGPGDPVEEPRGPTQYPPGPDEMHPSRSTGEAELRSFFLANGVTEKNMPSDLCVSVLRLANDQPPNSNPLSSIVLRLNGPVCCHVGRMDRINGHCETVAAALSNHVLTELRNGTSADTALSAGESVSLLTVWHQDCWTYPEIHAGASDD